MRIISGIPICFYVTTKCEFEKFIVKKFIDLCKGRVPLNEGIEFYKIFAIPRFLCKSPYEVMKKLQKAWWLEEEDIEQEIRYGMVKFRIELPLKRGIQFDRIFYLFAFLIWAYLLRDKTFIRLANWEHDYKLHLINLHCQEKKPGLHLSHVFKRDRFHSLSSSEIYILWLVYGCNLNYTQIKEIIYFTASKKEFDKKMDKILQKIKKEEGLWTQE